MARDSHILLVVGPTPVLAREALLANGLVPDGGRNLRMVTRVPGLRGWSHGTPVVFTRTDEWAMLAGWDGMQLGDVLFALINSGRLRIAQDEDIAQFKWEIAG